MLNLYQWTTIASTGPFRYNCDSVAGISGGRTSAMMAALLDPRVILTFQNTGREINRTLDYLNELDLALGKRIVWLEFRPPIRKGAPPREFTFAIVDYKTADRSGGPFEAFMQALADYRATKGLPPVTPWARQRLCTSYMKQKVQEHYVDSLGLDPLDSYVGLRADEPGRVHRMVARNTQSVTFRTPLYTAGITKADVMEFWSKQAFDLNLPEHLGNCVGCFLKDQADLSRAMSHPEADAPWWIAMENRYKDFGGRNFAGYAQLTREGPVRMQIESALRRGDEPANDGTLHPKRFRLVVLQERRRIADGPTPFSCSCETPVDADDMVEAAR